MPSTLGELIRSTRETRGMSQTTLATLAQVSQETVIRIEAGERLQPRVHLVARMARALGIPVEALVVHWLQGPSSRLRPRVSLAPACTESYAVSQETAYPKTL